MSQGLHHSSRRNSSSSTDQQAGHQEEEEEGAVGAIVDKLWKDLQVERVRSLTLFQAMCRSAHAHLLPDFSCIRL